MKKSIMETWVRALRSGKYNQCKGQLKNNNSFCCLGVLTDIYGEQEGIEWSQDEWLYINKCGDVRRECEGLTVNVQGWSGMTSSDGDRVRCVDSWDDEGKSITDSLADMNDSGSSFEEIADIIERDYKNL